MSEKNPGKNLRDHDQLQERERQRRDTIIEVADEQDERQRDTEIIIQKRTTFPARPFRIASSRRAPSAVATSHFSREQIHPYSGVLKKNLGLHRDSLLPIHAASWTCVRAI